MLLRAALPPVLLIVFVAVSDGAAAADADTVIPSGQDQLLADMLGRGVVLPGECRFSSGQADPAVIRAAYGCRDGEVVIELWPAGAAPANATHTARFAIAVGSGTPPPGLIAALEARIRTAETAFELRQLPGRTPLQTVLLVAVIGVPTAAALLSGVVLGRLLYRRRRGGGRPLRAETDRRHRALTALRIAGIVAIVLIALRGPAASPDGNLAALCGVIALAALLWLTAAGTFGFGSAGRSDSVGLVAFGVALVVREILTLHSVQDISIKFVDRPVIDGHSAIHPLLQLFFAPVVPDAQAFTMHLNGVFGALACLSLYLFVRQRLESRAVAFLCALFLAVHPVVARFSPTDGPYSLLLAAWFSGLALLSDRPLEPRAMLGGAALLGIAATGRIEGVLFLVASLLLLDLRGLLDGVRRDPLVAALSVLIVASLGAVQMFFALSLQLQQTGERFDAARLFAAAVWPAVYNDPVFTALILIGAVSGIVTRNRLGLLAYLAMLLVAAPVANSTYNVDALHRLVPACALQTIVAGIGAYSLAGWIRLPSRWRWLTAVPGAIAALYILVQHRSELTARYVFNEEYALIRRHLASPGNRATDCALMTLNENVALDIDLHTFRPVVPAMQTIDCHRTDCVAAVQAGGCYYYVRSAACYFHDRGVAAECAATGATAAGDRLACMNQACASFERAVELEDVERLTIDLLRTFPNRSANYPQEAEVGLFRVRAKSRQ
jgi:hypothetical protein